MEQQFIELTDANFKSRLLESTGIVLFYKKICPHCKALKKVIEKVATKDPNLVVMQIESEANPAAMAKLDVERVPTMLLMNDGHIFQRKTGLMNARELTSLIQSA